MFDSVLGTWMEKLELWQHIPFLDFYDIHILLIDLQKLRPLLASNNTSWNSEYKKDTNRTIHTITVILEDQKNVNQLGHEALSGDFQSSCGKVHA